MQALMGGAPMARHQIAEAFADQGRQFPDPINSVKYLKK
jgi:hypothetical protein